MPDAKPVILALDDEQLQLLTLRSQLEDLGKVVPFRTAGDALEFIKATACDAAIVDVHLHKHDRETKQGLDFIRQAHDCDPDLAVIVRTADPAEEIADGAFEHRAFRRAIKSRTNLRDIRRFTTDAIHETRLRREASRRSKDATQAQSKLAEALGAYDIRLTVADLQRGTLQMLRSDLTDLSLMVGALARDCTAPADASFALRLCQTDILLTGILDRLGASFEGPFAGAGTASEASVNQSLGALALFFSSAPKWSEERKHLTIRELADDLSIPCSPLQLTNALKHLVEYFCGLVPLGTDLPLTASFQPSGAEFLSTAPAERRIFNGSALNRSAPHIALQIKGPVPNPSPVEFLEGLTTSSNVRTEGNLYIFAQTVAAIGGALVASLNFRRELCVDCLLPLLS